MKELSIEEKAKAYDEAIKKAKITLGCCSSASNITEHTVYGIFPELKESEDEKIREKLIDTFNFYDPAMNSPFLLGIHKKDILAWLEKQGNVLDIEIPFGAKDSELQETSYHIPEGFHAEIEGNRVVIKRGEQKSADKVEPKDYSSIDPHFGKPIDKQKPKFREGDWIVQENIGTYKVIEVCECWYEVIDVEGNHYSIAFDKEYMCHFWTIQDAKDGDVLFHSDSASNGIFIFKELLKYKFSEKVICYCDYDSEDHFCLGENHSCCWTDAKILHPSTKEQCDTLFAKMKEAGYDWDADKKELKKIEQKPYGQREECLDCQFNYVGVCKGFCAMKRDEQKPQRMISAEAKEALFDYENANIQQKDFAPKEEVDNFNKVEDKQTLNIIEKGKWYVCDTPRYTDFALGKAYYCPKNGMLKPNENEMARYVAKDCFHLWTIQDAKDGDVLVASDGSIFLFAGVVDCACKYYVALTTDNYVKINKEAKGGYWETSRAVYPASKEQRDHLFQKMKEEGYEWNEETLDLKKIDIVR